MFGSTFRFIVAAVLILATCTVRGLPGAQSGSRSSSQPAEVHGQVRLASGGAPAEHTLVRLESFRGGIIAQITSDRTGKFRFSGLKPDQYIVTVRADGFNDVRQPVDLQTTTSAYVLLTLTPVESRRTSGTSVTPLVEANVPPEARQEFEKGRAALISEKKIKRAIAHLEKAIQLYPDFLEAQLLLGTAYMDAGQLEKAESALRRTLEIEPKIAEAHLALGEVFRLQRRYADAEKSLLNGLNLNERSWRGHFALAQTYWAMGDISRTAPHATKAHELNPDFPQVHLLMGNLFLRQRNAEQALMEFEDYLRIEPSGPSANQTRQLVKRIRQALESQKKPDM